MEEPEPLEVEESEPKMLGSWITIQQAELMLEHMRASAEWPDVAIYCHSCVTAIRSVTLTMQKALAHESGFEEWYAGVEAKLRADPEMQYLKEARNHILKRGALRLTHSFQFKYSGGLQIEMRGVGPGGPDIWIRDPENPGGEMVPVDWRRLDGFEFATPRRFGPMEGLPAPPKKELHQLLLEKIATLRLIVLEAEERFDPESFQAEEAGQQRKMLARILSPD